MKKSLALLLVCISFTTAGQPGNGQGNDRPQLPAMWMENTINFRVPVEHVESHEFETYVFLDSERGRVMHSSGRPDEHGVVTSHLRKEDLEEAGYPPSWMLMGFDNTGERYYNLGVNALPLHHFIAALSVSRIEATGIRHTPFYEYENDSAKEISLSLSGEKLSPQDIHLMIFEQTGCEIRELPNGTLSVNACSRPL